MFRAFAVVALTLFASGPAAAQQCGPAGCPAPGRAVAARSVAPAPRAVPQPRAVARPTTPVRVSPRWVDRPRLLGRVRGR